MDMIQKARHLPSLSCHSQKQLTVTFLKTSTTTYYRRNIFHKIIIKTNITSWLFGSENILTSLNMKTSKWLHCHRQTRQQFHSLLFEKHYFVSNIPCP